MARYIIRQDFEGDWNIYDRDTDEFVTRYENHCDADLELIEVHGELAQKLHEIQYVEETVVIGRLEARGYTITPPSLTG